MNNEVLEQVVKALCERNGWYYDDADAQMARDDVTFILRVFEEKNKAVGMSMDELLDKQKQLMGKVPHTITLGVEILMLDAVNVMHKLLTHLGACGHKPWRPEPLSADERETMLNDFDEYAGAFMDSAENFPVNDNPRDTLGTRQLISVLGVIEEALEYYDGLAIAYNEPNKLEEITDILFFYLELIAMSGFTLDQIAQEYKRKHAVNLERYRKAKEGDYSWDKRSGGKL